MELNFFAKAELFKNKFVALIIGKGLRAFPIKRGEADYNAIKTAMKILKQDKCLGVFPEGTRHKDTMGEFQRGFAAIAIKTNSKILPAYIEGDYKLFKKMHLIVGEPVDFTDQLDLKDRGAAEVYASLIRDEMIRLKETYGIYND